jgi:hypothetical protein
VLVVDDHILLDVLAGSASPEADELLGSNDVATTLSWYFRLGRAVHSSAITEVTRANLLTADAVATAVILDAEIAVSVATPLLEEAAAIAHVRVHLLK